MVLDPQTLPVSAWQPIRGPFTRWPRTADTVLAGVVLLLSLFVTDKVPDHDLAIRSARDLPATALFLFALASGALYWRRHSPLLVLGANLVALTLSMALANPESVWALPFALYSAGRYGSNDHWSYFGVGTALALTTINSLVTGEPTGSIGFGFLIVFLIWYIGRYIRVRGNYLRLLQERALQLEQEQASEARRAVAEERTRIARELHDVVAHRVSLMTVQAGAARTVAAHDPASALRAMQAVENVGRQALDELRHLLGVLRPEADAKELGPQPGVADIPALVEQLGDAGLEVSVSMDGDKSNLPTHINLATYRIVQEALTNVLKHAGLGARAEVRLSIDVRVIIVEVLDNGRGSTSLAGSGHGITGMRERAQAVGGSLAAEQRASGGFQVLARLPIGKQRP